MQNFFAESSEDARVESEEVTFNSKYETLLKHNGFSSLADFMLAPRENSFRDVPGRLTVGIDLKDNDKVQRVYLKRHWTLTSKKSDGPLKEAVSEWDNITDLTKNGISVPEALAYGYGIINGHSVAFVLMKEVPGMQADHFIERKLNIEYGHKDRIKLALRLGELARKFHSLGYNHRDFYLCHTFIHPENDDFTLNLIDLQRVQKRSIFRKRWIVKDLAQMAYSSLNITSNTDRMRFYLTYSGSDSLSAADKRLIKSIQKKVETMVKREKQGKVR